MTAIRLTVKRGIILLVLFSLVLPAAGARRSRRHRPRHRPRHRRSRVDYSSYVRKFADTILAKGRDVYGPKHTPLWAAVINARDLTVPRDGVPATPGVREDDRAVGGSNLYHDVVTLRVFRVLSALTGKPAYAMAARDYMAYSLKHARSAKTGFLAWGEHVYYDLYRDRPATERKWHELLGWTPPWRELWEVDPAAVTGAIEALRYHYYRDDPSSLYNRRAFFDLPVHQKPGGQPWIKHSGLFAYSFMFLYKQTGDRKWLAWSRGAGSLYWSKRNPATNLTPSCLGDARPEARNASIGQTKLAYWLLKSYQLNPRETQMWKEAVTLFKAYDRYAYDARDSRYHALVSLDGAAVGEGTAQPWNFSYGQANILPVGRIAAYFARTEKDPAFLEIARRVARLAKKTPLPRNITPEGLGFAINLNLDLYELTRQQRYLKDAKTYAGVAIKRLWVANPTGGLFVRQPGDSYYEAKLGVGDLLAGLLRLQIHTSKYATDPGLYDWSF